MRTPIALLLLACAVSPSAQIYDNWIYNLDGTTTGHWYYNGDAGGRERLLLVGELPVADHRGTSIASPTLTTFKAAMTFGTNGRAVNDFFSVHGVHFTRGRPANRRRW